MSQSLPYLNDDGSVRHRSAYRLTRSAQEMALIDAGIVALHNTPIRNLRFKSRKPVRKRKDPYIRVSTVPNQKKMSVIMRLHDISPNPKKKIYQYEFRPDEYLYIFQYKQWWLGFVPNTPLRVYAKDKTMCLARLLGENWYTDGNRWYTAHDVHRHLHFVWSADHKRTLPKKNIIPYFDKRIGMVMMTGRK